ncbi:hypothetical protein CP965_13545 [Halarcobacter mediterraneus]|uniref:STAS domain-containing protein n=1 Tax=Halarcobacter mediterraneus TaxID=2023153 RepID=A0A4Q1AT02_9BACT|nr:hypothetical protein [Halarcobacter mediterraneus]RXK11559.1 hypothetical protein CP965_13545 [Halarcobacter mediterraneus]
MKSNYSINEDILVLTLNLEDTKLDNFGIELLQIIRKKALHFVVFDLALFDVITSENISYIEKLISMLKLNDIDVIVCNFNVYSASILFHFIDEVSFKTELNIQKAVNAIKNIKKK